MSVSPVLFVSYPYDIFSVILAKVNNKSSFVPLFGDWVLDLDWGSGFKQWKFFFSACLDLVLLLSVCKRPFF